MMALHAALEYTLCIRAVVGGGGGAIPAHPGPERADPSGILTIWTNQPRYKYCWHWGRGSSITLALIWSVH